MKTGDLIGLDHRMVKLSAPSGFAVGSQHVEANAVIGLTALHSTVLVNGKAAGATVHIKPDASGGVLAMESAPTAASGAKPKTNYRGELLISAHDSSLRVVLVTDLESYVQGVLQSEVPANFKLEAMKAQAVLARTYGLHPRLPHTQDGFDVCDSFLHCQAFYGVRTLTAQQHEAIEETRNQILMYEGKPALALFSASAGGHTEDYENCFSDPLTNAFPPAPIPYLVGVPEGKLPSAFPSEKGMRALFVEPSPQTDDAWSHGTFSWRVNFTADALEAHMHHVVTVLQQDPQFAPFIKMPDSGKFGHIKSFRVNNRGVAGTAISITVETSTGDWTISKELTIRSLFENPDLKLKRLRSARIFFDHEYGGNRLLKLLMVSGFGSGHGVGFQQIGAQGLASSGKNYRQIIEHYYKGASIGQAQ